MTTQARVPWKGVLRWVRLTLSIGVLMVSFSIAGLWVWLLVHQTIVRNSPGADDAYFVGMLYLGFAAGLILGIVLGIVGRDTIWGTVLSALTTLGLLAFVTRFWIETYREQSGFFGKHFVTELFIYFLFFAAGVIVIAAIAAMIVMVREAQLGRHRDSGSPDLSKN